MAFLKILIAVCLATAAAEGPYNVYPNFEFDRYPPVPYLNSLPISRPLQFLSRLQSRLPPPPPIPQPQFFPPLFFGPPPIFERFPLPGAPLFELPEPRPGSITEIIDEPVDYGRDGSFSGLSVSSTNTGNGGMTIVTTNDNGQTQTFISPSPNGDGKFYRVSPPSSSTGTQTILVPSKKNPESKIPKIPPINMNTKSSKFKTFKSKTVDSKFHMSTINDEKPKIISKLINITNDNGKITKKVKKYVN